MPLIKIAFLHEVRLPIVSRNTLAKDDLTGPDSLQGVASDIQIGTDTLLLKFLSSVLALRGDHIGIQPLVGQSGNVLCWNGQVSQQ